MTGLWDDFKALALTTLILVVMLLGGIYGVLFTKKEDR